MNSNAIVNYVQVTIYHIHNVRVVVSIASDIYLQSHLPFAELVSQVGLAPALL